MVSIGTIARTGARAAAFSLMLASAAPHARGAEICRYGGGGDYHARIGIVTIAQRRGAAMQVRVLWQLTARALLIFHIRYLVEEVSTWDEGVLRSVGLNVRSSVNGRLIKQQWDLFERTADGFAAWRMQAKTREDFSARHAPFAGHWELSAFGAPWIADYHAGRPERRPDLDLRADEAPAGLVSPLAEAFYNVRQVRPQARRVALFLPGNKKQRRADIAVPAPLDAAGGAHVWRVRLDSERLGLRPGSQALLTVSPGGALSDIRFSLATARHEAQGEIHGEGCTGRADGP